MAPPPAPPAMLSGESHTMETKDLVQPRKSHTLDVLGVSLLTGIASYLDEFELCLSTMLVSKLLYRVVTSDELWLTILNRIMASWAAVDRESFLKIEKKLSARKQVVLIKRTRCQFCGRQCTSKVALGKVGLDAVESLHLRICTKCQPKYLITKSFAKSHYLVTDKALDQLPAAQKSWYGKKCKLYFQPSVLHISLQRWKTERILEKERENRRPFDRSNPSLPPWKRLTKPKSPPATGGGLSAICSDMAMIPATPSSIAAESYRQATFRFEGVDAGDRKQQSVPSPIYHHMPNQFHLRMVASALPPASMIMSSHPECSEAKLVVKQEVGESIVWGMGDENYWSSNQMFAD